MVREPQPVRHGTADGLLHNYNNPYPLYCERWHQYNGAFIEARVKMMEGSNGTSA